jgi:hypothetical protein
MLFPCETRCASEHKSLTQISSRDEWTAYPESGRFKKALSTCASRSCSCPCLGVLAVSALPWPSVVGTLRREPTDATRASHSASTGADIRSQATPSGASQHRQQEGVPHEDAPDCSSLFSPGPADDHALLAHPERNDSGDNASGVVCGATPVRNASSMKGCPLLITPRSSSHGTSPSSARMRI